MSINYYCSLTLSIFSMKILSIALIILLFFPLVGCILEISEVYYRYTSPLIPNSVIFEMAKSYIINGCILFICFLTALYLTAKRKYTVSIIMSSAVILLYLVAINFTRL